MTTIKKIFEMDKSLSFCDLDQLLKINEELKVWCLANNVRKKYKIL